MQLQNMIQSNPWFLPAVLGVVVVGILAGAGVLLFFNKREQENVRPFELFEEPEDFEREPDPRPEHYVRDDEERTQKLFAYEDMELKTYQLELQDLKAPERVYRVSMSDRITIGRKEHCTICIPNHTLSGEHCEIVLRNGRLYIHDLDSTNGTFLNGGNTRIKEEILGSGSVLELGSVKLRANISEIRL